MEALAKRGWNWPIIRVLPTVIALGGLMRLSNRSISDVLHALPDIELVETPENVDLLVVVLGFEDRSISVPALLAKLGARVRAIAIIEYHNAVVDNSVNREDMLEYLAGICDAPALIHSESEAGRALKSHVALLRQGSSPVRVCFDISGATSMLIVSVFSALLSSDVDLTVYYAEAKVYYPSRAEFTASPNGRLKEAGSLTESGVKDIFICPELPGQHYGPLSNALFITPGFNVERTKAMLGYVDEGLLTDAPSHVTWLIGVPHLEENSWRCEALENINEIEGEATKVKVSTFDYKDMIRVLEEARSKNWRNANLTLALLGSKLQVIGSCLFCLYRPEIRVIVSKPNQYMPKHYSEGTREIWKIPFGPTKILARLLLSVDELFVQEENL